MPETPPPEDSNGAGITATFFIVVSLVVSLLPVLWCLRSLYMIYKSGGRKLIFITVLLINVLVYFFFSPAAIRLYLKLDFSDDCVRGFKLFLMAQLSGIFLHQLVALESVLSLRNPLYTTDLFSMPCSISLSVALYVFAIAGVCSEHWLNLTSDSYVGAQSYTGAQSDFGELFSLLSQPNSSQQSDFGKVSTSFSHANSSVKSKIDLQSDVGKLFSLLSQANSSQKSNTGQKSNFAKLFSLFSKANSNQKSKFSKLFSLFSRPNSSQHSNIGNLLMSEHFTQFLSISHVTLYSKFGALFIFDFGALFAFCLLSVLILILTVVFTFKAPPSPPSDPDTHKKTTYWILAVATVTMVVAYLPFLLALFIIRCKPRSGFESEPHTEEERAALARAAASNAAVFITTSSLMSFRLFSDAFLCRLVFKKVLPVLQKQRPDLSENSGGIV